MKVSRRVLGLLAVVALVFAASACSKDSKTKAASSGGNTTANTNTTLPKGTPIVIYTTAPEDTAVGTSQPGIQESMKAITAYYNGQGGINGHPIDFHFCNDKEDANALTQCAQEAVTAKAAAFISPYANLPNHLPVLEAAGIPVLDAVALNAKAFSAPNSYLVAPGALGLAFGLGDVASKAGFKKVVVVASQIPATKPVTGSFVSSAKKAGVDVSKQLSVPPTLTDLSSIVAQVGNADAAFLLLPPPQVLAYLQAAKQSSSTVPLMSTSGLLQQGQIDQTGGASSPAEKGVLSSFFPTGSSPLWADFKKAIDAYSGKKGDIDVDNTAVQGTWVTMKVFTNVAKTVTGDVTAASFTAALQKANAVDTGGLTPTLDFTKPFGSAVFPRVFNRRIYFQLVKDGKFVDNSALGTVDTTQDFLNFGK
ncbi:MAG: lipoprotein [Acidimicrobiales bacterium]|nr:lipoprotein [Acidimicrobiales bacterium]